MFEKEAEEWAIDYICKDCSRYEKCKSKEHCTCKECSKDKWQNGAEFGYQKGIKTKINTTTVSDCPVKDEWHKQDTDDIYDFIAKDWSISYFICIMKDKSRVTAIGSCDEACNGEVSVNLFFEHDDEKYYLDDIVWWKEITLPKEIK